MELLLIVGVAVALIVASGGGSGSPATSTDVGTGTRGDRNNSPMNVEASSANYWQGQVGLDTAGFSGGVGLAVFDTVADGLRAGCVDAYNVMASCTSLGQFASTYSGDTSGSYANSLSFTLGVDPSQSYPLNSVSALSSMAGAVVIAEGNTPQSSGEYSTAATLALAYVGAS